MASRHYGFNDFMNDFDEPTYGNRDRNNFDFDNLANQGYGDQRDHSRIYQAMEDKNWETEGGYQAKVTGDVGELKLSSILKTLPSCYHVMDNILLKTKKGSTQIDHVIVSPFGLFIVETKNHKGLIFGDDEGAVWTQVLNKGHFKMYNPVHQNAGHIRELSKQAKLSPNCMQGILVFTSDFANLSNVNSRCCVTVDMLYDFIMSFNIPLFNEKQVYKIIKRIDYINKDSYMNRMRHVDYVQKIKNRRGW